MPGIPKESIRVLRTLSPAKLVNILLIWSSFMISRIIRRPVMWGQPVSLSFEPTTSCNLRCPECPSGLRSFTRPTGNLDLNNYKRIVDEQYRTLSYILLYFQGEPYLHPDFHEMVSYAKSKSIFTATSTNAHYLDDRMARATVESGLDKIIISIDGTTQETYEQYRIGGKLEKVIEGTKNLVNWKKKLRSTSPLIVFQFLVVKPNEHQIADLQSLANTIGVDVVSFKTAQLYEYEHGNALMPENSKYSRYKLGKNGKYQIKNKLYNHCWKMWHSAVVTWDTRVVPCCFDKDARHQLGTLNGERFSDIWQNNDYRKFRKNLLKGRDQIDICRNCTEGTKVWT
jgi:radical SAM protein with 4Fe4S-binding SPASM domain